MPVADDPDLTHLFELLRMLPGPRENQEFWTAVQHQAVGNDTHLGYVFEKMTSIWRTFQEPSPERINHLARYLLFFFAGENPELWQILNTLFHDGLSLRNDEPGRWWASDVCETAWTLYVRYHQPADGQWALKWQYEKSWHEWMPPRHRE
jgi:hypothetical protein